MGGGIEYFLTRNIAAGVESKWSYTGGHTITINDNSQTATLQAAVVTFGVRVYFYDFGR